MILSNNTIKLYEYILGKLDKKDLTNTQDISQYLETLSLSNKKSTLAAIMYHLKQQNSDQTIIDFYGKLARDVRIEDTILRIKRDITVEEDKNYISWDEVISMRDLFKNYKTKREHMKYILLCLYTYIPPQRGQCFYNCYIDKDVDGSNKIDTNYKQLILREYKTKRLYGEKTIDLPDELISILLIWKPNSSTGLLLFNNKNEMMTTSVFTSFLYSIFNRHISTDMLRKIYISNNISNKDICERKKIASDMGHSVLVQEFYYNKNFK